MFREAFRVIDLGVHFDQAAYPPWGYKAKHVSHAQGAKAMANSLNRIGFASASGEPIAREDFPEALGLAWTQVHLSDHSGNHIDAPYHFGPFVAGKPAKTIDEVPLQWCCGPGVRLDFRSHRGRDITPQDLQAELARSGARLEPGSIPLIWCGADEQIDDGRAYWRGQAGLSEAGLHWLLDRGVRLIGIDAYALDVSFQTMAQAEAAGEQRFFPLHFVGREREHLHLEKLANLGALPRADGFWFAAFPAKLRGASAGWVRPVALVPESHFAAAPGAASSAVDSSGGGTL